MFRALGSTSLHQAMNDRMIAMLGEQGESRMHQLLGARYAGCSTSSGATGGYGTMMGGGPGGGGMMGGYYNANGGFGAMMSSGSWSWMTGGAWQHMTRQDWQQRAAPTPRHPCEQPRPQRLEPARDHRRDPRRRASRFARDPRGHPPSIQTAADRRTGALADPPHLIRVGVDGAGVRR